jgi:hypothetical protein
VVACEGHVCGDQVASAASAGVLSCHDALSGASKSAKRERWFQHECMAMWPVRSSSSSGHVAAAHGPLPHTHLDGCQEDLHQVLRKGGRLEGQSLQLARLHHLWMEGDGQEQCQRQGM